MNYNTYNINYDNEQIIIPKKNFYCSNCNKKGHTYKNCNDSIISNGIIAIYIKDFDPNLIPELSMFINDKLHMHELPDGKGHKFSHWLEANAKLPNEKINPRIQFLMVQRKNSLGYLEFIRGRYDLYDLDLVVHLIKQMTPIEIESIINNDFDFLWNELWDTSNIKNKNHYKEYTRSKQHFYQLKLNNMEVLNNTKNSFKFNEWGFPKGRRELYESDLVCAIREFEEETYLKETEYNILNEVQSIRENLVGTNGINYAHNYFLAILNDDKQINSSLSMDKELLKSNKEIGDIQIIDLNESLNLIRPYHKNKVKIIKSIYNIINNFLINNN